MRHATPDESAPLVITLSMRVKEQLKKLAAASQRSETALAEEVIAAFVDDQAWAEAVEEGLADLNEGRSVRFEDVRAKWRERLATVGSEPRP